MDRGRCFLKDSCLFINQGGQGAFSYPHPLPEQNLTEQRWLFLVFGWHSEVGARGLCADPGRAEPSPRRWNRLSLAPSSCFCHPLPSSNILGAQGGVPGLYHGAQPGLAVHPLLDPTAHSAPGPPQTPSQSEPETGQSCAVLVLPEEGALVADGLGEAWV